MNSSGRITMLNSKGSAFLQALVAVGVVGIMLYFLSPQVLKHRQQVAKTSSIITARLALHSMVDFTLFGIKQRWCFSESWMPEPCGSSVPPTMAQILNHPRSVERLLMKNETVLFLKAMGISSADSVPLNSIKQRISLKSFSAMHPVYKIVADLKGYKVEAIDVVIERDRRGVVPEYGNELYLKVTVSLLDGAGNVLEVGSSKLTTVSYLGVYPREVGSFALLVAGDMRLDLQTAAGPGKGDAVVRQFPSRAEQIKYPGLIFESPVYTNGTVHLPKAPDLKSDKEEADTVYTPVTFKDKVILGSGPVMRDNKEFRPRSSGDEGDQFWAHIRQFGGFQKGVEVDGGRDLGLDYLSGYATGSPTGDPSLMERCIGYNLAKYDLNRTAESELRGQLLKENGSKYQYRLGMTEKNRFNPQTGQVDAPSMTRSGWFGEVLKDWKLDKKDGAVAHYTMSIGRMVVSGEIPDNGTVTLVPEVNLKQLKDKIERQLMDAESQLLFEQSRLKDIEKQLSRAEDDLADLQKELATAEGKKPVDQPKVSSLKNQIDFVEGRIRTLRKQREDQNLKIADAQNKVDDLQKQKAAVAAKEGIQPKIYISVKKTVDPNDDKGNTNATFRDLEVSFEHPELILSSNGDPLDMSLQLEAYDVAYYNGNSLRTWSQAQKGNNKGWLFFKRNGGTGISVSQNISDSIGNSKGNLPDDDPFTNYDLACLTGGSGSSAFGGTDWTRSFAPNAKHSWSFTNKYEDRTNYIFDANNAYRAASGGGTATFVIKSMARDCIVKSTANFVTGFFACERLVIESRSTPLRIIGTFILSNGLSIAPDAYASGIRWSTIYHPMATFELRQAGVLKALDNQDCSSIARYPIWHPYPAMKEVANLYRCNAISLRSKADPFRWTSVDPDCGLVPNSNSTMCKNRLVRFYVLEVSRESGI